MDKYAKLWSITLFSAYVIKLLLKGAAMSDAIIALGLAAVYVFLEYKAQNKQLLELKQEFNSIKEDVKYSKEIAEKANNAVTGLKVGAALKRV